MQGRTGGWLSRSLAPAHWRASMRDVGTGILKLGVRGHQRRHFRTILMLSPLFFTQVGLLEDDY